MITDELQDIAMANNPADALKPLKQWRDQFEANHLQAADLVQFLELSSAAFYTVAIKEPLMCAYDDDGAKCAVLDVIEEFICGDNPQTVHERIAMEGSVSSVCGHVFKINEPTYSCRECGTDSTCVLCVTCFKQSPHRTHKYKMGTSGGGGCCDCGDAEAWKRDAACTLHATARNVTDSAVINERMRQRCALVFDALLAYCTQSLRIETDAALKATTGTGRADEEQIYCTVMYNDETHTFEQVIQTLTRIVGCSQKDAVDFVSSIDREGRAVVKCAPFEKCRKLKEEIESTTPRANLHLAKVTALKVAVLHMDAVACQQLALQLLGWMQEFCARHGVFRAIFARQVTAGQHLQHIMQYDWKLWKTARLGWHHLLITAMLMEYENKKQLALVFTKLYPSLMSDYIRDDHEHSFSIVSMSVQLFTVPSIAQHLIAHESAFYKLMHTFYSESIEKYVSKKVLIFARQTANQNVFKRAGFILFDLKYILSFRPDVWTDELRKNFLHGVQVLMRLLKEMQGMDCVYRQTGQHMEYEPEWESAFNLHIKLAHVITLVLEWCGTDQVVLVKVYRMVMANLAESEFILAQTKPEVRELADHSASTLMYDVMSKVVSIHLPLSRFFAGLYLHLHRFGYGFDNIMGNATKPTPEELIEPVLCTQTMIAQVHSGMWRRNGYSLLNQLYFYRNVKCRGEMLDRDIVALQIGASLIEANEFLIHVLSKFGLMAWAGAEFEAQAPEEDGIRQTINMLDEMLELLITVLGERHMPGVGMCDDRQRLQKELIQQLCIKPHSHSELSKTLTEAQQADAEEIIGAVAAFDKPTARSDKKGVYVLRREFYDEYNMFYYHYTKEEKSRSEETHRERRKEAKLLDCCPPPRLPQLCANFETMVCVLNCDVMLLVMRTVLQRSLDLKARHFSESHLQKVLHLIGYALHEEESGAYPYFKFVQRAAKSGILPMLEELMGSARVEVHRDLLLWTVRRYAVVQAKVAAEAKEEEDKEASAAAGDGSVEMAGDGAAGGGEQQVGESSSNAAGGSAAAEQMESQSCTTTTTTAAVDATADADAVPAAEAAPATNQSAAETERVEKETRQRLAAERRAKIMAQMKSAQTSFMATNAALFKNADSGVAGTTHGAMDWQPAGGEQTADGAAAQSHRITACLGRPKGPPSLTAVPHDEYTCILCSEDAIVDQRSEVMVYSAFIQTSKVMAHANNQGVSPHVNSCGHVMHVSCWLKYFENEAVKETRRPNRNRAPGTFHIDKKEFLCPLCRCLSNVVLPVPTALSNYAMSDRKPRLPVLSITKAELTELANKSRANLGMGLGFVEMDTSNYSSIRIIDDSTTTDPISPPVSPSTSTTIPAAATPPVSFATWLTIMIEYTATLNRTDQFTEITETNYFAAKLPDLRSLVEPHADYAAFVACCPTSAERHSLTPELIQYIESFIEMARKVSPFPFASEACEPYIVGWLACAYTVEALEMQLRATGKPLKGHMSIRQTSGLRGLLRVGGLLSLCCTTNSAAKMAVQLRGLLNTVLGDDEVVASSAADNESLSSPSSSSSVVSYDVFKMMASLVFLVPTVLYVMTNECAVPNGQMMDFYLLQLMHVANVVKVLLLHDEEAASGATPRTTDSGMDVDVVAEATTTEPTTVDVEQTSSSPSASQATSNNLRDSDDPLVAFYRKYNFYADPAATSAAPMTRARLNAIVAAGSATFLRCSVLLFHSLTDVEMPDELAKPTTDAASIADNYEHMCAYLGLNADAGAYFADDEQIDGGAVPSATARFAARLAENRAHAQLRRGAPATVEAAVARQAIVPCVTPISEFVELPEDYSDLINSVSQFTCPNNMRDDTRNPTMCLICGAILCSMTYCCQVEVNGATVGACTAHTMSCGAGVGAFLRIRDCEVLLLGFNKGCFVSAPYLDEYGETDQGLRRGNALRLCPERLRKLHMMWLTHCMHEDIARLAESSNSMIQTQWQNM